MARVVGGSRRPHIHTSRLRASRCTGVVTSLSPAPRGAIRVRQRAHPPAPQCAWEEEEEGERWRRPPSGGCGGVAGRRRKEREEEEQHSQHTTSSLGQHLVSSCLPHAPTHPITHAVRSPPLTPFAPLVQYPRRARRDRRAFVLLDECRFATSSVFEGGGGPGGRRPGSNEWCKASQTERRTRNARQGREAHYHKGVRVCPREE